MTTESLLKTEEKASLELRGLYRDYGYLPYKMSKFEEYDYYASNKDFLVSDGIISFTGTNGKLLALKPDVTLSIIKNFREEPGVVQRVYYDESVYRISGATNDFKEITQTGLEAMGDLDFFNVFEVVVCAIKSLKTISKKFVLEISHMGFLAAMLKEADKGAAFEKAIATCVGEKNRHELARYCDLYGVSEELKDKLTQFIGIYGERDKVLSELKELAGDNEDMLNALAELTDLSTAIDGMSESSHVRFDFSLVSDMSYYSGLVFQGFVEGVPEVILSGGQYDKLMARLGYQSGAIGFALYLDLLENIRVNSKKFDVDIVLLYTENSDYAALRETLKEFNKQGKTVSVQKAVPTNISYASLMKFNDKGVEVLERND